jgi:tetratricopeptide (TPR) repeat protein
MIMSIRPSIRWSDLRVVGALMVGMFGPSTGALAQSRSMYINTGDSLLKLDKPQRAMEFYEKAIALGPDAQALLGRSKAWYMMDRMDRFLLDVEGALRLDSTLGEAHVPMKPRGPKYPQEKPSSTPRTVT